MKRACIRIKKEEIQLILEALDMLSQDYQGDHPEQEMLERLDARFSSLMARMQHKAKPGRPRLLDVRPHRLFKEMADFIRENGSSYTAEIERELGWYRGRLSQAINKWGLPEGFAKRSSTRADVSFSRRGKNHYPVQEIYERT